MITAYVVGPQWDWTDPSPFCMKLLTYLSLAKLDYETKTGMAYSRKSPKGKMPFIRDGDTVVGDSNLIALHLKEHHGVDLDQHLSPGQKATAHALGRMLDEHTYWCLLHFRWVDERNWEQFTRPAFFDSLPFLQRKLLPGILRKGLKKNVVAQGIGRHSPEEIAQLGIRDYQCLVDVLGDQPFMFGDKPSAFDATAYAFCAGMIKVPHQSPIREFVENSPLVDYVERVAARL